MFVILFDFLVCCLIIILAPWIWSVRLIFCQNLFSYFKGLSWTLFGVHACVIPSDSCYSGHIFPHNIWIEACLSKSTISMCYLRTCVDCIIKGGSEFYDDEQKSKCLHLRKPNGSCWCNHKISLHVICSVNLSWDLTLM